MAVVLAVAASIATVAVTQADSSSPAGAAKLQPPVIHEPQYASSLPCPSKPTATPDLEGCIGKRLLATDKKIDKLNKRIFTELSEADYVELNREHVLRKFLVSHRAWLAYREANCSNLWASTEEGTIYPVVTGECTVAINKQRIKELRAFQQWPE